MENKIIFLLSCVCRTPRYGAHRYDPLVAHLSPKIYANLALLHFFQNLLLTKNVATLLEKKPDMILCMQATEYCFYFFSSYQQIAKKIFILSYCRLLNHKSAFCKFFLYTTTKEFLRWLWRPRCNDRATLARST